MTAKPPRFEFRCWPDAVDAHVGRLERRLAFGDAEARTDIYLLAPGRTDLMPKLRGGTVLELKARLGTWGLLERWHPVVSDPFPLSAPSLTLLAGLFPDADTSACASPDCLREALAGAADIRHVRKTRRKHTKNGLRAENTRAECDGRVHASLAFECEDAGQLDGEIHALGLAGMANCNYAAALRDPSLFGFEHRQAERRF
tara:strand:- start:9285 stop:9887 length:603 start_codon:yes stop_codon:yes gene_type:complete